MNSTTNTDSTTIAMPTAKPSVAPYEVVRFNALKHGILSRYTVLSHENLWWSSFFGHFNRFFNCRLMLESNG